MNSLISVSLVINFDPDWQVQNIIDKLLSSEMDCVITVVDNGKKIRNHLEKNKKIRYIFNNKHIGYANAHNLAFNNYSLDSKYHLISNVDVDFDQDVLSELYNFMEENNDCGMVGPKILNKDGSTYNSCKLLPTPLDILMGKFGKKYLKYFSSYELNISKIPQSTIIPFISGCFLFCKSDVLRKIKGMDGNFFLFMDDVDLSRRVNEVSKVYYCEKASIKHLHGRIHTQSLYLTFISIKSVVYYFNKFGWIKDNFRNRINHKTIQKLLSL